MKINNIYAQAVEQNIAGLCLGIITNVTEEGDWHHITLSSDVVISYDETSKVWGVDFNNNQYSLDGVLEACIEEVYSRHLPNGKAIFEEYGLIDRIRESISTMENGLFEFRVKRCERNLVDDIERYLSNLGYRVYHNHTICGGEYDTELLVRSIK